MNGAYNQMNGIPPRYQEDGGRGAGMIMGATMGVAAVGGAYYGGNAYQRSVNDRINSTMYQSKSGKNLSGAALTSKRNAEMRKHWINKTMNNTHVSKAMGHLGGTKGKVIAGVGAALVGGLLGAALDDPNS
jgi:hypothetical protein